MLWWEKTEPEKTRGVLVREEGLKGNAEELRTELAEDLRSRSLFYGGGSEGELETTRA